MSLHAIGIQILAQSILFLLSQLLSAGRGQAVILELTLALGRSLPLGGQPALAFQPVQRRIQRSVFHLQYFFAGPLDVFGDFVAMPRAQQQGPENQHVQRTLEQLDPILVALALCHKM